MRQAYTIGGGYDRDADGSPIGELPVAVIMLEGHRQHIWSESHATVSARVLERVRRLLGEGPYTNPIGNFGHADRVYLHVEDV